MFEALEMWGRRIMGKIKQTERKTNQELSNKIESNTRTRH